MILWNHLTRRVWNFSAESIVCRMFSGWMLHCIELDSKDFKEYVQRAIERCVIKRNSLENEKVMATFEWEPVGFVFPAPRNWKTTFLLNELIKLAFDIFVEIIDKVETMPKCGHWVFWQPFAAIFFRQWKRCEWGQSLRHGKAAWDEK